jgi:hypothetical protein
MHSYLNLSVVLRQRAVGQERILGRLCGYFITCSFCQSFCVGLALLFVDSKNHVVRRVSLTVCPRDRGSGSGPCHPQVVLLGLRRMPSRRSERARPDDDGPDNSSREPPAILLSPSLIPDKTSPQHVRVRQQRFNPANSIILYRPIPPLATTTEPHEARFAVRSAIAIFLAPLGASPNNEIRRQCERFDSRNCRTLFEQFSHVRTLFVHCNTQRRSPRTIPEVDAGTPA